MTERAVDQELTWQQQRILNDAYQQNERKLWKAYALALIFGGTGVYRFYLGRKWTAILMFFCNAIGLGTFEYSFTAAHDDSGAIFGICVIGGVALWIVVDLFLIPRMVRQFNAGLEEELKKKLMKEWTA